MLKEYNEVKENIKNPENAVGNIIQKRWDVLYHL